MSDEQMIPVPRKACAIVGTAPTWIHAPWTDTSVDILGLNDGYALGWRKGWEGLPRATHWFDLHPIAQMSFVPKGKRNISQAEVPVGAYLRPEGHLQWLKSRPFPVFVHTKPPDWPATVQTFPRDALQAKFGTYFASTPAWMLAWAMDQGYTEVHIYGIHLATEWEYVSQRPNFEFLLGLAASRGIKLVLPNKCPLLKSKHVYAYEPKPDLPVQASQARMAQVKQEGAALRQTLHSLKFYEHGRRQDLLTRLEVVDLELADAKLAHHRAVQMVHG